MRGLVDAIARARENTFDDPNEKDWFKPFASELDALELAEEAGLAAGSMIPLGHIWASPGIFTEVVHLFLARDLSPVPARPEQDEVLEAHWIPLTEIGRAHV